MIRRGGNCDWKVGYCTVDIFPRSDRRIFYVGVGYRLTSLLGIHQALSFGILIIRDDDTVTFPFIFFLEPLPAVSIDLAPCPRSRSKCAAMAKACSRTQPSSKNARSVSRRLSGSSLFFRRTTKRFGSASKLFAAKGRAFALGRTHPSSSWTQSTLCFGRKSVGRKTCTRCKNPDWTRH